MTMKEENKILTIGSVLGLGYSGISKLSNAVASINVVNMNKALGLNKLQYLGITSSELCRLELLVVGLILAPIAGMAIGYLIKQRKASKI
ncbi:MAG: hypothetical protein ACRCX8_18550 [Sarcina sp.]